MRLAPLIVIALVGCSESDRIALEATTEHAVACVDEKLAGEKLVSSERADSIVEACRPDFERWTQALVEKAYDKPLVATDHRMMTTYRRELDEKIELMKLRISEGPHQDFPAI